MSSISSNEFDVIIVGGGVAGCATALSLRRSHPRASFLLLDNSDPDLFKVGESLPSQAGLLLDYLCPGLSNRLAHDTAKGLHKPCIGNASAWASSDLRDAKVKRNDINGKETESERLGNGYHLDRKVFDAMLRETVAENMKMANSGVTGLSRIERSKFLSVNRNGVNGQNWSVAVEDLSSGMQQIYLSKWIVDATGRRASVLRQIGVTTLKPDPLLSFYALFSCPSLATTVSNAAKEAGAYTDTDTDPDTRTIVEAAPNGWWYSSQLAHNTRIVAYHTDSDRTSPSDAAAPPPRTADAFLNQLHHEARHISAIIQDCGYDFCVDESKKHDRYPRWTAAGTAYLEGGKWWDPEERWCAVGDAAMAFDPLSSQGMITALKMGALVGDVIAKRLKVGSGDAGGGGDEEVVHTIESWCGKIREDYERNRAVSYGRVKRFETGFWKRRQTGN